MKKFSVKPCVCFDENPLEQLSCLAKGFAFIVTDPFMASNHMVDKVVDALAPGVESKVYTDVKPDPDQELVDRGIQELVACKPEVLIAFGGGSAIDAAKAIMYLAVERGLCKRPVFIAIPTTAGTGSETTNFAVITRGTEKIVLIDDSMYPDYALLEAQFTKSVPTPITIDTGIDVLTHAIEAYVSNQASMFTDVLAERAICEVFEHLPILADDGLRTKSRKKMIEASCMAGMAFTNAGLGINHSLAHCVGGAFHVAHGRLNAIFLPYVMSFNADKSEEAARKYAQLAKLLGVGSTSNDFVEAYKCLAQKLGIPSSLRGLGRIDEGAYFAALGDLAQTAQNDRCTPANPAVCSRQDLINLLRDAYEG